MWVQLDDGFFRHRKVMPLPPAAKLLFIAGLTHCADQLTDGFIATGSARAIAGLIGVPMTTGRALVDAGLWHKRQDGFDVHDYLKYQKSADQVRSDRARTSERVQSWRHANNSRSTGVGNAVTSPVTTPVTTPVTNRDGNDVGTGRPTPIDLKEVGSKLQQCYPQAGENEEGKALCLGCRGTGFMTDSHGKHRCPVPECPYAVCPTCLGSRHSDIDNTGTAIPCPDCQEQP